MDKNKLIFVVDDDPFMTSLIVKSFSSEGFRVESFDYGEDCLRAMDKMKPDLIILDYYFTKPGQEVMNGIEILDKIRSKYTDIYIIMLSAQEKGEVVLELARKGINDYIIKDNNLIDNLGFSVKELLGAKSELGS
ncbi:MAG TPA: response regulator [Bacteroidales bacterium]|nr:response regulator [Bacteroidales bacterium]